MVEKVGFSKKLLVGIIALTLAITAFTCVMMWRTGDLSPLSYLIPSVFGELATSTGFYYWKAKRENEIKFQKWYGLTSEESCDVRC